MTHDDLDPTTPLIDTSRRSRLLVVDDQAANVQALYQAFCADHQVLMATSGEQALALCAAKQPDLVLLDVVMPGMDGHEVCRRLKADHATRHIPVIFVTAQHDEQAETDGLDAGAVDFISKPINPRIVRARVKTHLTLKRQSDLLRRWAYIDGLTGVFNRRYFDQELTKAWQQAQAARQPLSLLMIDVDLFKRYNDHHGHQAGDTCLRRVAAVLRSSLTHPDGVLTRYGGEEFACLLPGADLALARAQAERMAQHVRSAAIEHLASTVSSRVSVSLGGCTFQPAQRGSVQALLRQADTQLYAAKAQGRDRACMAPFAES